MDVDFRSSIGGYFQVPCTKKVRHSFRLDYSNAQHEKFCRSSSIKNWKNARFFPQSKCICGGNGTKCLSVLIIVAETPSGNFRMRITHRVSGRMRRNGAECVVRPKRNCGITTTNKRGKVIKENPWHLKIYISDNSTGLGL